MADYPNGGTPPTITTEVPAPAPITQHPNTGSNSAVDLGLAGAIILACGIAVVRINRWYFWRRPAR